MNKLSIILISLGLLVIAGSAAVFFILRGSGETLSYASYTDINGKKVPVTADGYEALVIIYGNTGCSRTSSLVYGLGKASELKNKAKIIYADAHKNSRANVKAFAEANASHIYFCYDTDSGINEDMWEFAEKAGCSTRVNYPVVVIADGENHIKKITTGSVLAADVYGEINRFLKS